MLDAHFNILLSSNRRETATSRCPTRRPRRCPRRSRCCCRALEARGAHLQRDVHGQQHAQPEMKPALPTTLQLRRPVHRSVPQLGTGKVGAAAPMWPAAQWRGGHRDWHMRHRAELLSTTFGARGAAAPAGRGSLPVPAQVCNFIRPQSEHSSPHCTHI